MKKNKKEINELLRNEIINEIRYINTSGLKLILFYIYDLESNNYSEYLKGSYENN